MEEIRLQKFFTDNNIMSRRAAEKEIAAGKVKVNGVRAEIGQKIDPAKDKVEYKGQLIRPAAKRRHTYIMLNKPAGYVTTLSDEEGRKTVLDLISDLDTRVYPVGRLDMYSEGLLLMSNDGELVNVLTHPRHHIPKIYHVKISKNVPIETLKQLSEPMEIDGYKLKPVEVRYLSVRSDETILEMKLYEGRNRQIRKMCQQLDLPISKLTRMSVGEIELGDLVSGKWRYLTKAEVAYLMRIKDTAMAQEAKRKSKEKNKC